MLFRRRGADDLLPQALSPEQQQKPRGKRSQQPQPACTEQRGRGSEQAGRRQPRAAQKPKQRHSVRTVMAGMGVQDRISVTTLSAESSFSRALAESIRR